jgi:hypothetical protein
VHFVAARLWAVLSIAIAVVHHQNFSARPRGCERPLYFLSAILHRRRWTPTTNPLDLALAGRGLGA